MVTLAFLPSSQRFRPRQTPAEPFGDWIGQLFVEGITAGCGQNNFCPGTEIPNQQMATFLVKAFQIPHQ